MPAARRKRLEPVRRYWQGSRRHEQAFAITHLMQDLQIGPAVEDRVNRANRWIERTDRRADPLSNRKTGCAAGAIPAKLSLNIRPNTAAGFANEVLAVNQ